LQLNSHAKTREQQNYSIPLSKNKKFLLEKNEPIIPQKSVNQEEFKNPKTLSQKESKREIMLNKKQRKPIKTNPNIKEKNN
jgi:sucrose-6-phosphate hydrolase SacC (GH32 family)